MLCAGIAAAGGNCVDAAAWGVVAEIGSLKQMAGGFRSFGEFAEISRLLWLQGEARSGQVSALRRCRNLQWWVWI